MRSNNILEMQNAVKSWVKRHMPKDTNKAVTGIVQGNRVIINNQSLPFIPAVNIFFENGDSVVCLLPDSGNVAVVVGVR